MSLYAASPSRITRLRPALCWLAVLLLVLPARPLPADDADDAGSYPITDPYEATVSGTPVELKHRLGRTKRHMDADDLELLVFPDRKPPPLFDSVRSLAFRLAYHDKPAPLLFVIAGTGGSYRSSTARYLQRVFFQAGFHVITLSSPSSHDFIVAASESQYPGISEDDARDLYRVMQMALQQARERITVTDVYLTGYSLGGLQAAFVSHRDEQEQAIGFRKVLLLNPPVNLYTSAALLDGLVGSDPNMHNAHDYYSQLFDKFARYFAEHGMIRLDDEAFMFKFQESEQSLTHEELMALIGASFRFSSAGLVFTVDALNRTGRVVEPGQTLTLGTPLEQYFKRGLWWRFTDYYEHLLVPYWQKRQPQEGAAELAARIGLPALRDYLANSDKIGVISNSDEIILTQEDLEFLSATFGERATLFPRGGHLGNLQHRDYVAKMLAFFTTGPYAGADQP